MATADDGTYRHPWLGVEMRHLATFVAVARTRSFRRAAAELGYAVSAVSQQISQLERAVGTGLVERRRGHRSGSLTPAGQVLFERSVAILGELSAARTDMAAAASGRSDLIRLAVPDDGSARLLGDLLARVRVELPSLRLRMVEAVGDDELVTQLEHGHADAAIGAPAPDPRLVRLPLLDDPYVVLAPAGSPLARASAIASVAELDGRRVIVPASGPLDAHLRAAGVPVEQVLRVPVMAAVPALVASGAGLGLVPRSAAAAAGRDVVAVPTAGILAPRRLSLWWLAARRRTAALERFAAAVAAASAQEPASTRPTLAQAA